MQAHLSYTFKRPIDDESKVFEASSMPQKSSFLKKSRAKKQEKTSNHELEILAQNTWSLTQTSQEENTKNTLVQKEILQIITKKQCTSISLFYEEIDINISNNTQNDNKKNTSQNQRIHQNPDINAWDSLLLATFASIIENAKKYSIPITYDKLPEKMHALLTVELLASDKSPTPKRSILENFGNLAIELPRAIINAAEFLGEVTYALAKFCIGRASCAARDIWQELYLCSAASLPIISLVSLLLGLILAFVSAMQLKALGAELYVASLVTISMVRVMGPVLTGIVIAGRTGASYAATIGSMQVNEEVDALNTFGISPVEFLILPKVLALTIMMPFLTMYANFMGILGAFLVTTLGMDISPSAFIENVQFMMNISSLWIGLFHSFVFGFVISLASCYQGLICGRSAESVGKATTNAVVNSIVGIIISTSIITIILSVE